MGAIHAVVYLWSDTNAMTQYVCVRLRSRRLRGATWLFTSRSVRDQVSVSPCGARGCYWNIHYSDSPEWEAVSKSSIFDDEFMAATEAASTLEKRKDISVVKVESCSSG